MGTSMYPSSTLLGQHIDVSTLDDLIDKFIEKADEFAEVFAVMSSLALILTGVLIIKLLHPFNKFPVKTKNQRYHLTIIYIFIIFNYLKELTANIKLFLISNVRINLKFK